jgi:hypothetical protein
VGHSLGYFSSPGFPSALWDSAIDGRDRIPFTSASNHSHPRRGVNLEGRDRAGLKGKLSPVLYLFAVVATLRSSWIAQAVLVIAALIWLIPDQRIEKRLAVSGRLAIGPR